MRDSLRGLMAHMRSGLRSGLRADLRSERENWKAEWRPESSDFRLKRANLGLKGPISGQRGLNTSLGGLI